MLEIHRSCLVALAAVCVALPADAQKFIPKQISFIGTSASQAELLSVSGLQPGQTLTQADIQAAAQKLLDTGMFSDIRFAFDGVDLQYTLKPAQNFQPVLFANFPWWDQQALNAAVAARVPLFHGSVPPESAMQQQVAAALTAMLKEKGLDAIVSAVPAKDLATGKDTGIQYHIDAPPVQVGTVILAGAGAAWADPVAAIEKAAAGQDFDGATEATLQMALQAVYHREGYLQVQMTGFAHGVPQMGDGKVQVPVTATIVEGPQYRLGALHLAGDVLMKPEDFAKAAQLHPGDVLNEDKLRGTMAMIANPYKAHGYLRAKIDAAPQFDETAHTVTYDITVVPGPVFHMGELSLINLTDEQKAAVTKLWPMSQGDVFDATVATQFLLRNKNALHALDGWSATWKAYEHEDTHVVDLVVTFQKGGSLR